MAMNKNATTPLLATIIVIFVLANSGCINDYGHPIAGSTPAQLTSIVKNPAQWNGRTVQLKGVFNFEFEGDALYLTKQDLTAHNYEHSIFLVLDDPSLNIPFYQPNGDDHWLRGILTTGSLRMRKGKPAIVSGVFKATVGGRAPGYVQVKHLIFPNG